MNIKTFKVERWMNDYEEGAVYNLGETCIDSLTLGELLDICGGNSRDFFEELKNTRLTYGHIFGSDGFLLCRSEERRVGKECRSRWSPYH